MDIFLVSEILPADILNSSLFLLTSELITLTAPSNLSLLPLDLNDTNYLVDNIIRRLPMDSLETVIKSVVILRVYMLMTLTEKE